MCENIVNHASFMRLELSEIAFYRRHFAFRLLPRVSVRHISASQKQCYLPASSLTLGPLPNRAARSRKM